MPKQMKGFGSRVGAVCLAAGLGIGHATSTAQEADQPIIDLTSVAFGQALAEANCARCHAVGFGGDSPHPEAPAFWAIEDRRPVDTIAEMLIDRASPKHTDMPTFEIREDQAEALAAWIAWVQPITHGKRLVETNCAECHAVGPTGDSPHPNAPTFKEIVDYYPIDGLEEGLAEGIVANHPDMPVFQLTALQVADVLAYLETLTAPPSETE
ncbi:MAG: cytochrome c [Pseudomonadota bacterium]